MILVFEDEIIYTTISLRALLLPSHLDDVVAGGDDVHPPSRLGVRYYILLRH
jgi:hypothetical protein